MADDLFVYGLIWPSVAWDNALEWSGLA